MAARSKKSAVSKGYVAPSYKAYLFRDKDPVIDQLRTMAEDYFGEKITSKNLGQIEKAGGPNRWTMKQWFFGKTRRPTNASSEAAGRSIGFERIWKKMRS
jgi:hypothetical protein